jgi:hypothetical protein
LLCLGALQSTRYQPLEPMRYRARLILSWNSLPVQSVLPTAYRGVLVRRSPLRRWAYPRPCGFSQPTSQGLLSRSQQYLSSGSAFLQSLTRLILANPTREASGTATLMSFGSLQHITVSRVHIVRVRRARFVPSSGFGYPRDGFRPSKPRRPCFMPTALVGFLTPFGAFPSRKVPETITSLGEPACRWSTVTPSGEPAGRTDRPRLPGFDPFGSPLHDPLRLTARRAGCSPGLSPFQGNPPTALIAPPRDLLSRAWRRGRSADHRDPAPQSINRRPAGPILPARTNPHAQDRTALLRFLRHADPARSS